jgi:lipopolysaccharide export system protein LptA
MKKNKLILAVLAGCMMLMLQCNAVLAAPASDAKYSVDAAEIEYDMASGDGTATGRTTIRYGDGTAVAEGGATFNSKERTGHLFGGVTASKEDNRLRSQELVLYTPDFISAMGDAVLTKGDKTLQAPRVDFHNDRKFAETLGGYARLSSADGNWLTAGKIVYDISTGRVNATGGVNMANSGRKMTGSGDRAVYDSHETGYIELIGNAKITQDGNTVTGNKLRVTNLSGSDSRMQANGNVRIVYYPEPAADKKAPGNEKILVRGKDEDTVQKASSHTEDKKA